MGTLLRLEPPAPLLRAELRERLGLDVPLRDAERAVAREIAYYRAHLQEGRDPATLRALRRRCAAAMLPALPAGVDLDALADALVASLRFAAFPDAPPALRAWRARGVRLVVASNWDVSLHDVMARVGIAPLLDGVVTSAEAGAAKPDPAIFARALALAGVDAGAAWHVGDSPDADVAGARAAGLVPVLIARDGPPADAPGVRVVRALTELAG